MHLATAWLTINSSVLHACQKEMQTGTRSVTHYIFSNLAGNTGLHYILSCIILLAHPYFSARFKITYFQLPEWEFWHFCHTNQNLVKKTFALLLDSYDFLEKLLGLKKEKWFLISCCRNAVNLSATSFFCQGTDSKYFEFSGLYDFCSNHSTLLVQCKRNHG